MARILIVSGIWPPDIGGPASHGPELGQFLGARGHDVRAVTSTPDGQAENFGFPVRGVRRDLPVVLRLPAGLAAVTAACRDVDVVYATGLYNRIAVAAAVARRPLVVKLVNDPAFERARRMGLFSGTVEEFQDASGPRIAALKHARDLAFRRATRIVSVGHYLAKVAQGWGLPAERFTVVPNPAPPVDVSVPRDELRRRFGFDGVTAVFAGRFVAQKNVPLAVRALAHAPAMRLVLIGEGPEQPAIEAAVREAGVGDRVRIEPAKPREEAMQWVRAADAAVLPSDWEGFPHAAVEALSVGTPVIATSVGAVPEIVEPGENGLLVPAGDATALGEALAAASTDPELLGRLRDGAGRTGDRYAPARTFSAIEAELEAALGTGATRS